MNKAAEVALAVFCIMGALVWAGAYAYVLVSSLWSLV